jgi:hypothetical protein
METFGKQTSLKMTFHLEAYFRLFNLRPRRQAVCDLERGGRGRGLVGHRGRRPPQGVGGQEVRQVLPEHVASQQRLLCAGSVHMAATFPEVQITICILRRAFSRNSNDVYLIFWQFFLCELLNFIVDVFNLYFTDVFLGGRFLKYGTQVIKFYSHSHAERRDLPNPMCTVFPTVTRYESGRFARCHIP